MSYKNPPEHTRWKKGQSGNPNGRPPVNHIRTQVQELLSFEALDKKGNPVGASNLEVLLRNLLLSGAKGNVKATELLLNYGYGKPNQPMEVSNADADIEYKFKQKAMQEVISQLDTATIENMVSRLEQGEDCDIRIYLEDKNDLLE